MKYIKQLFKNVLWLCKNDLSKQNEFIVSGESIKQSLNRAEKKFQGRTEEDFEREMQNLYKW